MGGWQRLLVPCSEPAREGPSPQSGKGGASKLRSSSGGPVNHMLGVEGRGNVILGAFCQPWTVLCSQFLWPQSWWGMGLL